MFANSLIALLALFGAIDEAKPAQASVAEDKFADREDARIPFASQLDHFQVKRENKEDILYLSTGFGVWYRAPLMCTGFGDPRYAIGIIPVDAHMGIDQFSRFKFYGGGNNADDFPCSIQGLKKLTPQETVDFKLESQKSVDNRIAKEKEKANKSKP